MTEGRRHKLAAPMHIREATTDYERWLRRQTPVVASALGEKHERMRKDDELRLLHAMGMETANIHLGSRRQTKPVLADLDARPGQWLWRAAKTMARAVERDWKEYRG